MRIPEYINRKDNIIRLVIFTSIFALIFINIYKPFSSSNWYNVSEFLFFVYSSLIILTGVLVVVISRIIMFFYNKKNDISYLKYSLWVFFEILFMAIFYTAYTIILDYQKDIMSVFESSFINTTLVLLLPYTVLWFYMGWKESNKKLEEIKERQADLYNINKPDAKIAFFDYKGDLKISITIPELLFIESCENYVIINYINKDNLLKKYLLRNTLKNVEEYLNSTNIVRCHRSYLVNLNRAKVIRKDGLNTIIELDHPNSPEINISKTYLKKVSQKFIEER